MSTKARPMWVSRCVLVLAATSSVSCRSRGRAVEAAPTSTGAAAVAHEPSASAAAAVPAAEPHRVALEGKAMGTRVTIAAFTSDALPEEALRPKLDKALGEIRRLEALMTTWRDDSEISRINAAAGKHVVAVSRETLDVIDKSLWISRASGGVFDITFASMGPLWKFDETPDMHVPSNDEVEKARKRIDWRKIEVDDGASTVELTSPTTRINLGGIGKGYAVDAAARVLRAEGLASFFVQAGGDLFVQGKKPDGSRWRVGIRDPRGKGETDFFAMLDVEDHAFSTAGDYERGFVKDGKRYHHIIDPRTGFPATASRSVTIWAKDALTADAIDDAVFILGPQEGLALVESIDDTGAVIVDSHNKVWTSKRLADRIQLLRQPTDGI